ncbi:MAG TPA: hypothetical protein VNX88_22620 [Terriglobales bacterium]|jgi:metal-responsive CopG/Arc/MetJ family transcriptional regulator|nr:hypothetical protein [Terriglobales bacterium]
MKEKTSITLSTEVLADLDRLGGKRRSRSALIESILRYYLKQKERSRLHARELERLNEAAERLNEEAADVLEYQFGEE